MKKVVRLAVAATVVLVIVGGAFLLAANLYVQSPPVQQQIRQALAATLKMPVEMTKTTITPWEGLRIDGITIRPAPVAGQAETSDFLKAESFRARFAFVPLFKRQFVVRQVLLDHPQLSLTQNAEGRWQFPSEKAKPSVKVREPSPATASVAAATSPAAATPPSPGETAGADQAAATASGAPVPATEANASPRAAKQQSNGPKEPTGFSVAVDKFKMRHGRLEFLDRSAQTVGRFEDVNLDGRLTGPRRATGSLWFNQALLPLAGLALTDFNSRFDYDEEAGLSLSDGKGGLAGGSVTVNYRLHTQEAGSPFAVRCGIDGVALEQLLPPGSGNPMIGGRLQGNFEFKGMSDDVESRRGSAELSVLNAEFKNMPFLQMLGDALRINDLSHPQLKKAELRCRLEGSMLYVEPLTLAATDLQITAQGSYETAKDRLDLQARLTIDKAVSRQLPQGVEAMFTLCGDEAPGSRYIDFPITGSISKPSTNLRERLLSGTLNSFLQSVRPPKQKTPNPNKKSKHDSPSPDNTPAEEAQ